MGFHLTGNPFRGYPYIFRASGPVRPYRKPKWAYGIVIFTAVKYYPKARRAFRYGRVRTCVTRRVTLLMGRPLRAYPIVSTGVTRRVTQYYKVTPKGLPVVVIR